jgi:putative sigma-54 modulation protein
MQFTLNGKNLRITSELQEYVEKRAGKLDRYLPDIQEVRMDLAVQNTRSPGDRHVAQLTVRNNGTILRAEERAQEMTVAIDAVMDKMHRQIARFKGKREDRWRGQGPGRSIADSPPVSEETWEEVAEEQNRHIARVKRFFVYPMDEEEAIEQMELLGHDFFVFFNANSGTMNVLYRRHDGNYGLLEPQVG